VPVVEATDQRHRDNAERSWPPVALLTALLICAAIACPAEAASRATRWNGANPFRCTLQTAGPRPGGADPGADPYCLQFNPSHPHFIDQGIVDFLLKKPGRVAAASPKCFSFQSSRWRGAVSRWDPVAIYAFAAHYFFDKATGDAGTWVTGFTVFGRTFNPRALPGFPPGYGRDFRLGTGGFIRHHAVPTSPRCITRAARRREAIYRTRPASR
jgi:hypothetical protein